MLCVSVQHLMHPCGFRHCLTYLPGASRLQHPGTRHIITMADPERDACPVHRLHCSETGMSQTWSTPLCMYVGLLNFLPNHVVQGDDR